MKDRDKLEKVTEWLDASLEEIPPAVGFRLTAARKTALRAPVPGHRKWLRTLAFGAAAAAVAAGLLIPPEASRTASVSEDDLDVVVAAGRHEMVEEMEFYQWVAAVDRTSYSGEAGR